MLPEDRRPSDDLNAEAGALGQSDAVAPALASEAAGRRDLWGSGGAAGRRVLAPHAADGPVGPVSFYPSPHGLPEGNGLRRVGHEDLESREAAAAHPPVDVRGRRVMFFGKRMSRSRCTGALVDALRENGLEVRWRNLATLRRWLGRRCAIDVVRREFARFRPDLVFVFCMDLPRELLEEFRLATRVVLWVEEPWISGQDRMDYLRLADLVCLSNPTLVPAMRAHGVSQLSFQMSGFSPRYHFPVEASRPSRDLAFIGGPGAGDRRAEFLLRLADSCDVDVFGVGWDRYRNAHPRLRIHAPIGNRGFRRVCAESRIVLGMNQVDADPLYFSNRIWLTLACRGFHLTRYVPGMEQIFERGEHVDWFHDLDEAVVQVGHYLRNDAERLRIAAAGHRLAVASHQYRHRVAAVMQEVERLRHGAAGRVVDGSFAAGPSSSPGSADGLPPGRIARTS